MLPDRPPTAVDFGYRDFDVGRETLVIVTGKYEKDDRCPDPDEYLHELASVLESQSIYLTWEAALAVGFDVCLSDENSAPIESILAYRYDTDSDLLQFRIKKRIRQINSLWGCGCLFLLYLTSPRGKLACWFSKNHIEPADLDDASRISLTLHSKTTPNFDELYMWEEYQYE